MKKLVFLTLFLFFSFFNYQISAQTEEIKSIRIISTWGGLGTPSQSKLVIEQKKGKFYADGRRIDSELIDKAFKTLKPTDEKINLSDFGITQEWLNANAERALPQYLKNSAQNERDLFLNTFRDIKFVENILPKVLAGGWTDDYPSFEMEIIRNDNSKIEISSKQQPIFMLPWNIVENGNSYLFANPKFSLAVANLLPKKFTNRERLSGEHLAEEIAEKIYREIDEKIEELETQNKIGNEIIKLKNHYMIGKTAINNISSIDTGTPTSAYQTKEYRKWNYPSWNAELQKIDLPANVIVRVSLPYRENKLATFNVFLEKIDGIIHQALSVPWLAKSITENPNIKFQIRFVEDRSFSKKAKDSFLEDLKVFRSESLSSEILNQLDTSIFLEVSEKFPSQWSRWLILPDKRMILWQIRGDSVLKWKPSDFETRNKYDEKDWFQAKAIISPNGGIESR